MNIYILPILILIMLSCSDNKNTVNENALDSLKAEIKYRDSCMEDMLQHLTDLRIMRSSSVKEKNSLYGKISPETIDNYEFAALLNTFDTTISHWNGFYSTRIFKSCNGPGDSTLEYCNCSDNLYITTGAGDIPEEYYLFKVGPFMEASIDSFNRKNSILHFKHQIRGKTKSERVKINLTSVKFEPY